MGTRHGTVIPNMSGRAGDVVIHMPAGVDPHAVVRAQHTYNRRNGVTK
jgi:hypothetical protein